MRPNATTLATGLAMACLAMAWVRRPAIAAAPVTPLNCTPTGPSSSQNATPPLSYTVQNGAVIQQVTLLEPAASPSTPRTYLMLQTLGGVVYFTADSTQPATGQQQIVQTGAYVLQAGGDRITWQATPNGSTVPQGAIYAIATGGNPGLVTCKVYPQ